MKLFLSLLSLLFCLTVSAAFQYEVVEATTPATGPNAVYGYEYYIKVTQGSGTLYITDKINNIYSMSGNKEILSLNADMTNYGYIDLSTNNVVKGNGNIITTTSQVNQWNDVITQTSYELGTFSEGDMIGVWLTNKKGNTGASVYDHINSINSKNMVYREYGSTSDVYNIPLAQLNYKSGSVFFSITGKEMPSGQPLPGTLFSLCLGISAILILLVNKHCQHYKKTHA